MLALLTLLAGAALADAPPPPDALPEPTSSGDRRTGPFSRDTYPSQLSARPLTLPAGMIRAGAAMDTEYIRVASFAWSTNVGFAGSYGLSDRVELGAAASFGLAPLLEAQRVGLSAAVLVHDGTTVDLALALALEAAPSFLAPTPAAGLSLPGRVLLSDQLFLTFGAQLFRLELAPVMPQVALRLGLGGQVTSSVAVALETDVLKLAAQGLLFRRLLLPLDLSATAAVSRGFDLRLRVQVFNVANPLVAGTFTLAGSAYF